VVYFTMSISPNYLEAAANVAVTAKSLGVKAFVNLSQMTVSEMSETETTSSPQQKQHWLAEQMLRWSGLPVDGPVCAGVQPRSGPHHPIRQRAATNLGSQAPRGSTAGASD